MIFTIDNTNDSKKWTQNEQDSQSKQNWLDHGKIQISPSYGSSLEYFSARYGINEILKKIIDLLPIPVLGGGDAVAPLLR